MTINTPKQALVIANGTRVNREGFCQQVTRGYYLAPSAGDVDGDGDADAYDGWLSEPAWARHPGDRNPPAGYPVSFKGGSRGHGHRAISLGGGKVRSTDFDGLTKRYKAGVLGNSTIAEVEAAMGVTYLGWSKTIDGLTIPPDPVTKPAAEEKPVATTPSGVPFTLFRDRYNHDHIVDLDLLDLIVANSKNPALVQAAKEVRNACRNAVHTMMEEVG